MWIRALALLATVRVAVPLAALAFEGRSLPGLPRWDFVALTGDATGYYAAAREFIASWGRLSPVALAAAGGAAVAAAVALAAAWRRRPAHRTWFAVAAALGLALLVALGVSQMSSPGAAVFGWPLAWSLPMLPYRALGLPLDPEIAFGFGLALSLAANVVTVVATAYAGLYATGRRSVGLAAAALYVVWPFLTGVLGGSRAWENGTWQVDVGLHLYTEPLSTALVTAALALVLRPQAAPLQLALAGIALGLGTAVKLTNGLVAGLALLLLATRLGVRRALPFLAGTLALAPVVAAYWRLGYPQHFDNPRSWPRDPFSLRYLDTSWTDSLLFTPRTLLVLVPVALVGALALRQRPALAPLAAWALVNPVFYSFYANTALHPRFLHASLPAVFVLWATGALALYRHAERAAEATLVLARRATRNP